MAVNKRRIYDLAKDFNVSSKAMVDIIRDLGFEIKSHSSTVGADVINAVTAKLSSAKEEVKQGLERKKQKELERKKSEDEVLRQKKEAEKRIMAELTRSKKKMVKKVESGKIDFRKKKDKRRKRKDRVVDTKAVKAAFRQTMSSLGTGTKKKKYQRHDKDSLEIPSELTKTIKASEFITVSELATLMELKPAQVVAKCMELGMMATINQRLDMDTLATIALEFGFNVEEDKMVEEQAEVAEKDQNDITRHPVVTIMGHVDHGKTSLLDFIRKSNIIAGESGGITQHIGAYMVKRSSGNITFLDTPGHEAFSAMRARGAQVTDIVILVVAADDSVMPQTIEAIDHARAAGVPIIVAINKIDLPGINIDNIKNQLAKHNLVTEEWGGKTIMVQISAKFGTNVDKLLEMVLLQAEMMDLKANPDRRATGAIIEAKLDRGKGVITTVLVQKGTLRVGDPFVTGIYSGRVRAIFDERGNRLEEVGPATPAMILGSDGVPQAGDTLFVTASETEAKSLSQKRLRLKRERDYRMISRIKLTDVYDRIKEGQIRELNLIIKGDVDGSVEALSDTLSKIVHKEVAVRVIHRGVGAINESDVMLAAASQAIIIGFHTRPEFKAAELAVREHVDIKLYKIIYEVETDIKKALEGLLAPELVEIKTGQAEIRQLIKVPKLGHIAGSIVKEGVIRRNAKCRITRNKVVITEATITSLKRFKDDVREVQTGFECGIGLSGIGEAQIGDFIEAYDIEERVRTLESV